MTRFIVFIYASYESGGGFHDIYKDENGAKVFTSEKEIEAFIAGYHGEHNMQVVDLDKLKIIAHYRYVWINDYNSGHYRKDKNWN